MSTPSQIKLRACQVVSSINENTGGTATAISALAGSLANANIDSHIFTLDYSSHGSQIIPKKVDIHSYSAHFIAQNFRGYQPYAHRQLKDLASCFDLLHNHGLWMFPNLYARNASVENNIPLITSPRGMLESWSLDRSKLVKKLAWSLYEHKNLSCATAFHATSQEEANSIRRAGFKSPIAVIPDGVSLPDLNYTPPREVLTKHFPELEGCHWLLFLSRLHPKKGLENLIHIWKMVSVKFPDWHLVIAGPDWKGYRSKLEAIVESQSLGKRVTFTGMLTGIEKTVILSNSDLFILPTYSENFGIVVAESLAHGVPVITTNEAPWQDLNVYQCGWCINNNLDELTDILTEAMKISKTERHEMGIRGYQLVKSKYSWDSIACDMASFYRWILSGDKMPDCIVDI